MVPETGAVGDLCTRLCEGESGPQWLAQARTGSPIQLDAAGKKTLLERLVDSRGLASRRLALRVPRPASAKTEQSSSTRSTITRERSCVP
jgi:hypothetical protein